MSAKPSDDEGAAVEPVDPAYTHEVGGRLRAIRKQQRLSLQAVEARSEGRFKAVVVGSYERGAELADFYGVPITELLPQGSVAPPLASHGAAAVKLVLNLRRLRELPLEQSEAADRYARTIQAERGDYGNDVLSLRADDLRPLAIMYGTTPEELVARWRASGIVRDALNSAPPTGIDAAQ
jgi:transcriptional regulator with XRE-family HTH domain